MGEVRRRRLAKPPRKVDEKINVPPRATQARRKIIAQEGGLTVYSDGTYDGYISAVDIYRSKQSNKESFFDPRD